MTGMVPKAGNSSLSLYVVRPMAKVTPLALTIVVLSSLFIAWLERDEDFLTPKFGLGYWLGICGAALMLLLLIYSVRKRTKAMQWIGSIPFWFRIHLMCGIAGPTLILLHSNFRLGALNSNVALFTMLIVMASGIVGRYIYGHVHTGLDGRKAIAKEILAEAEALKKQLGAEMRVGDYVLAELNRFSYPVLAAPSTGALSSLWSGGALAVRSRFLRVRILAAVRRLILVEGKALGWPWRERRARFLEVSRVVKLYFDAVLGAAELAFFERLFALWHVLHLPLMFLMVMAAVIHVWAVHRY